MKFGRQAEFSLCTPPVCPAVTPKALALPLPRAALPELRPPAAATGLAIGEEAISPSPRTTIEVAATSTHAPEPITKTVTVHFKFGDASLSAAGKVILDSAVAAAPNAEHIVISGRTDSIGPASANELLAIARARTVYDYLHATHPRLGPLLKLDAQRACCYVASNETAVGRGSSRRVEVYLSGDGEQLSGPLPTP